MLQPDVIAGAGLSGLIAACAWPETEIHEINAAPSIHRALLRFRTDAVAQLTRIPFRKVRVHKAVLASGWDLTLNPTLADMNRYSEKVVGVPRARSIGDMRPVDRYVAPDDFIERLVDRHAARIFWESNALIKHPASRIVSTAPLHVTALRYGLIDDLKAVQFNRREISVYRAHLSPDTDVHQTVYDCLPSTKIYRASITGNVFIVEFAGSPHADVMESESNAMLEKVFRINQTPMRSSVHRQTHGKIVEIDETLRRHLIRNLTIQNVYSLGRFATWRNILLDDLVQDIEVIDRLLQADNYITKF